MDCAEILKGREYPLGATVVGCDLAFHKQFIKFAVSRIISDIRKFEISSTAKSLRP